MTDRSRPRWVIHSEVFDGSVSHSIWSGSNRIAADIGSIEEASIVRAAPELLAFAQIILRLTGSHPSEPPSLASVLDAYRNIVALAQTPIAPPSFDVSHSQESTVEPTSKATGVSGKIAAPPRQPLFDELFKAALDEVRNEALQSGWTLQRLAKQVGISRAQFTRWRKSPPMTIKAVTKLQTALRAGAPPVEGDPTRTISAAPRQTDRHAHAPAPSSLAQANAEIKDARSSSR